jgi:hypothetical protein
VADQHSELLKKGKEVEMLKAKIANIQTKVEQTARFQ